MTVITNSVPTCPVTRATIVDETGPTNTKVDLTVVVPSHSGPRLFTTQSAAWWHPNLACAS